ncbi:Uncharacterized protein conserved in bacteria with the myosin-like domain [Mycoplasmopsis citelli]|uniref:Uncharacterized protein conserved in bacteria with the myosin-like domain n=1 Tax=Mycoplasmopsis citelli TaxID=171281 RepID=A0A449B1R4_9BACT|nr:hypothetical protein [Mycoplasmopsis citelli]VEU74474.1 Uncharacterized protein conserved in bacteria with the myosin-like domain [Mycoplasmopsis citelli]
MKLSRKRNLLLSFAGALLLGTGIGIGFGTGKTVNQNQIGFLSSKINSLNFELQQYNQANKVAKLKINNLKTQSEKLQLFVKDLNELNLSSENLSDLSSKITQEKVSDDGFKAFEQPFSTWKSNLVNKISTLNTTLKNLSSNNDSLSGETQQGINTSLNKIKELLNSLEKIAFAFTDTNSVIKVFESIQKAQNTFLAQLTNIISLITIEISKHNQATNELNEEIAQRDEKIKELVKKLTNQLNFYLKLISRLRKNLKQFNKLNFEQVDKTTGEKIKTKINKTLKLLKSKETHFKQLLDQINQSLVDAKNDNDYSSVQSYDLNEVNKGFEKIVNEYDLIRSSVISLYEKNNQERGLQIVNLQNQNNALQSQIDTLNEQKTDLEQNLEQTKNDLTNNLASILENQITTLSGIEQTIRNSNYLDSETLADNLQEQINSLNNLKDKYNNENYKETFIPTIKQALTSAQNAIEQYKQNIFEPLKSDHQRTLESLNSTKEELVSTQSELNAKNQEIANTQNSLNAVRAELEQNKIILTKTQETLRTTQSQLEGLNTQITTNKIQAKAVYDTAKALYENLKSKAQNFLRSISQNVNFSQLSTQLAEVSPTFDDNTTLEQNQATIKSLIELSTNLNNAYQSALQQDYDSRTTTLNNTISSLNGLKDQLQRNINNLIQKQTNLSSSLNANINSLSREYTDIKTKANKVKNKAKQWQIDVSRIEKLLAISNLNNPRNNLDEQINFINEYITRISNLTTEVFELQNKIITKTEKRITKNIADQDQGTNDQISALNNSLRLKEQQINGLNKRISNLIDQINNKIWETHLDEKNSQISNLNQQIKTLEKQIEKGRTDLTEMTSKYTEYKNLIFNSDWFSWATTSENYYDEWFFGNAYSTDSDKDKYGKFFTKFNPGKKPQIVAAINSIKVLPAKHIKDTPFKFKISYIDLNDNNKIKTIIKNISYLDALERNEYAFSISKRIEEPEDGVTQITEEFVVVKYMNNLGFEFTNVVATYFSDIPRDNRLFDEMTGITYEEPEYDLPFRAKNPVVSVVTV